MTLEHIRNSSDLYLQFVLLGKPHARRLWFGGRFPWVHICDQDCLACALQAEIDRRETRIER